MHDPIEKAYALISQSYLKSKITVPLPESGLPGFVGFDGREYPQPTLEQVKAAFSENAATVHTKQAQGFTRLFLSPLAAPIEPLMASLSSLLLECERGGQLFPTRAVGAAEGRAVQVNETEQAWMWDRVRGVLDTDRVVYFPQEYKPDGHGGMTKSQAISQPGLCAVPGWSIGLIEPLVFLPKPGSGSLLAGRKQLENGDYPREYLRILAQPEYAGETGWTLEDFLAYFALRLVTEKQVSHDRFDGNALWLLGMYLPDLPKTPNLVMEAFWSGRVGKKLYLSAHRAGNHFPDWGARTMVRLAGGLARE